jgi:hypothetical protein
MYVLPLTHQQHYYLANIPAGSVTNRHDARHLISPDTTPSLSSTSLADAPRTPSLVGPTKPQKVRCFSFYAFIYIPDILQVREIFPTLTASNLNMVYLDVAASGDQDMPQVLEPIARRTHRAACCGIQQENVDE